MREESRVLCCVGVRKSGCGSGPAVRTQYLNTLATAGRTRFHLCDDAERGYTSLASFDHFVDQVKPWPLHWLSHQNLEMIPLSKRADLDHTEDALEVCWFVERQASTANRLWLAGSWEAKMETQKEIIDTCACHCGVFVCVFQQHLRLHHIWVFVIRTAKRNTK